MVNLIKLMNELKERKFKITNTQKGERIQQTESNALKHELLESAFADLKNQYEFTFRGKDGIMLEIANDSIADNIKNETGSGAITITLDIKVNGLELDAQAESQSYAIEQKEKAEKKAKAKESKDKKIAKDKAERQAKADQAN